MIIIAIFIALTDFLDGKLARLWGVSSDIGAKLDTIGDKALAIGLLIILVVDNQMFFYIYSMLQFLIYIVQGYESYHTLFLLSYILSTLRNLQEVFSNYHYVCMYLHDMLHMCNSCTVFHLTDIHKLDYKPLHILLVGIIYPIYLVRCF